MIDRKLKSHKRYILYRLYAAIVWIGFGIFVISWILAFATDRGPSTVQFIWFAILAPCFTVAVFMLMSLGIFPFAYSVFGPLQRTTFPNEQPVFKQTGTGGQIGLFRATAPFISWYVYSSGLGISILGMGKVFIPAEFIKSLNEDGGSFFSRSRYQLIHNSPEVSGPIYLPDKKLFDTLRSGIGKESLEGRIERHEANVPRAKSARLNFFLVIAIIWGIPIMLFGLGNMWARSNIEIEGEVISRQVGQYDTPYRWYADYNIRLDDGKIIHYRAEGNDTSLSRDIPVGAKLIKKKWSLNYSVNGTEVDDFPRVFYPLTAAIGFLIFAGGLFVGIRRLRK